MEFRSVPDIDAALLSLLPTLKGQFDCLACCSDDAAVAAQLLANHLRLPLRRVEAGVPESVAATDIRLLMVELAVADALQARDLKAVGQRLYPAGEVSVLGVYGTDLAEAELDIVVQIVPSIPFFEWNFLQREGLDRVCFDIDGVLCEDPTYEQNDDGPLYRAFLSSARPLHLPDRQVGWLVTSRLEKYRDLTEQWMVDHGVSFGGLHMIDLPNKEARKAANCHGSFKAEVYADLDADLFIESNPHQAWEIAERTGKPVFCVDTMQMVDLSGPAPSKDSPKSEEDPLAKRARRVVGRLVRRLR